MRRRIDPTAEWRKGDIVSCGSGESAVMGRVIELRRRTDNRPFLMVEVIGGMGRLGHRSFLSGQMAWVMGVGPCQSTCVECEQPFRHDGSAAGLCQRCARLAFAPDYDPHAISTAHGRARLRGHATPYQSPSPETSAAAPFRDDPFEGTPF